MTGWVDFEEIDRFEPTPQLMLATYDFLREYGRRGLEGRVLWGGIRTGPRSFNLDTADFPQQRSTRISTRVSADEIDRALDRIARAGRILACQVHTHPGDPWHSDIDDDYPIVTQWGSLSLVIPDFARDPPGNLAHCALYRLQEKGWADLTSNLRTLLPYGPKEGV